MQNCKEYRRIRREMRLLDKQARQLLAWAKYDKQVKDARLREAQKEEELSWNDSTLSARI